MSKAYTLILTVLALVSAAVVILPNRLIQPFRPQTENEVALAYQLFRWAPFVSLAALLLGAVALAGFWRREPSRRWKAAALSLVLALGGLAVTARLNLYERIFPPLDEAAFASAAEAGHLAPEEMVLGVAIGGEAKAYPVGLLAYHHVVNDEAGGVPLAVTY